jgi:hypothetical protein
MKVFETDGDEVDALIRHNDGMLGTNRDRAAALYALAASQEILDVAINGYLDDGRVDPKQEAEHVSLFTW